MGSVAQFGFQDRFVPIVDSFLSDERKGRQGTLNGYIAGPILSNAPLPILSIGQRAAGAP